MAEWCSTGGNQDDDHLGSTTDLRLLLQAHGVVNEHPHAVIPMGGEGSLTSNWPLTHSSKRSSMKFHPHLGEQEPAAALFDHIALNVRYDAAVKSAGVGIALGDHLKTGQ